MRAEKAPANARRHAGCDRRDRQATGVGGENGVRLEVRDDLLEQSLLDGEVLGDGFDHPIAIRQQRQIVVEVTHADACRVRGVVKRRRLILLECLQRADDGC